MRFSKEMRRETTYPIIVTEVKCAFTKSYGRLAIDEFPWKGRSSDSVHGHPEFQVTVIQVFVGTSELNM